MMFKLRRKSQKKAQPKEFQLTGMPALKQRRSSKREESLAAKRMALQQNSSLSQDFDGLKLQTNDHQTEHISPTEFHQERMYTSVIEDCTAYKPVDSTECLDYGVDFNENEGDDHRESLHFYDEVMRSISEDVIGDEDDYGKNSDWKLTNGDSGYKSLDRKYANEGNVEPDQSKEETQQRSNVLHVVKEQRKASREGSLRNSLRALTPRERESILCLEEVLKYHSDGDESVDEVFDGRTSQVELDVDVFLKYNCKDEPSDDARRMSVDSISTEGSIIDLVGNLSEISPQVSPSPEYSTTMSTSNHILPSIDSSVMRSENPDIDSSLQADLAAYESKPLAKDVDVIDLSDFTELHGSMESTKRKKSTASTENWEIATDMRRDIKRDAEEPIYAQVNKPKKKAGVNGALKDREFTEIKRIEIENRPPSPNHVPESVQPYPNADIPSPTKTNFRNPTPEFAYQKTSTPRTDLHSTPSLGRLFVEKYISENTLQESAHGLRHIERSSSKNKVFLVEPAKHRKVEITEIKNEDGNNKVGNGGDPDVKSGNACLPKKLDSNKNVVAKRESFNERPLSYSRDKNDNLPWSNPEQKQRFVIRPYSSFKMDKSECTYVKKDTQNRPPTRVTSKPFIIRPAAKKIELY